MAFRIAPSILSADFARLGEEVRAVVKAGADLIHFDVMDNHYVPNLTVGPLVCAAIRPHVTVPLDVHLMVRPVDRLVQDFAKAGANIISFHPEASDHVDRTLSLIREQGCKAGLVFNPATPLAWLDHSLDKLDLVLLMSVNPGFGGQQFIPAVLPKIAEARRRIAAAGRDIWLEVDGGVKTENIAEVARAGRRYLRVGFGHFRRQGLRRDHPRHARAACRSGIVRPAVQPFPAQLETLSWRSWRRWRR
jgi:ribulose-phosphate 3-epimerase